MDSPSAQSQYRRLNEHFQACLELSPTERESYVSNLAATDADLGRDLSSLLRFHEEGSPPASPGTAAPVEKKSPRRTRRIRISAPVAILGAGGIVLAIVLGVQWYALAILERDLKQQMAGNLKAAIDLRVSNLRGWVAAQKQHAQKVLQEPGLVAEVTRLLESVREGDDRETQKKRLLAHPSVPAIAERMRRAPPEITDRGYMVLTPSGLLVAADFEALVGDTLSAAGAGYLGRVNLGETIVSRPYPDRFYSRILAAEPQHPVMYIAGPIRDAQGRVIAVGSFRFTPSRLYELLSAPVAEFVAFDAKGQVLSPLRDGGAPFQSLMRDPGVDLASGRKPVAPAESWPPTLMARSAVQELDGLDAEGHRDLRGREVVGAWTWLGEWEMGIGAQVPLDLVLAPAQPVRRANLALVAGLALVTAGLASAARFVRIRPRRKEAAFGAYVVERSIGKGGMAEVFLARHAFLRRPAALKILNEPRPDADTIQRFEREARLASTLAHPNTIQVFDFGETPDGRLYAAMEYVEGLTVAQFVALFGPPPVARAIQWLRQVAGSLREAHEVDLHHRDLKPSNIMVTARGGVADLVKVLDFGIACSAAPGNIDYTRTTSVIGTPAFLAPERIRSPQLLDARSDIYSFGAAAFYLVTGRNVFEGNSPIELIYQVMTAPRPQPSRLRGEALPAALERLILKCLSADLESRPSSVDEVEAVLESLAADHPWSLDQARDWWRENRERVTSFIRAAS
jgi:hypothetical protein